MHVCIYWWEGIGSQWQDGTKVQWVGYQAHLSDKENRIYEAKVPYSETCNVVWNNGVNGGSDTTAEIFQYACQTTDANIEGAKPGDYDTLPEGTPDPDSMESCILIPCDMNSQSGEMLSYNLVGGDWYVYYGDGCYGNYATESVNFLGREENCVNPEHFDESGNHIGTEDPEYVGGVIYFDNSTTKWEGPVQFYIFDPEAGEQLIAWGSKKLNGTNVGNNIWAYNTSDYMTLEANKQYCIIFSDNGSTAYTYDLMMDSNCFGDIGYATGKSTSGAYDSGSSGQDARWTNSSLGPRLQISEFGEVIGKTCPAYTSPYQLLVDFLSDDLYMARQYSGKDDQTLIDDIKKGLGLSHADVISAIDEAGVTVDWNPQIGAAILGDADGDGDVTSIDATIIQRYDALIPTDIDEATLMNGDVDSNGELEIIDATYLQRYLAMMDVTYPIGETIG